MTTQHGKHFIFIFLLSFSGCAEWNTPTQYLELSPDQPKSIVAQQENRVPQTLEPAPPIIKVAQSAEPDIVEAAATPSPPSTKASTIPPAAEINTNSASSQPETTGGSPPLTGNVFGEFPGVSSQWEERKKQLTIQLQEQSQKINALKVKLELINQVAEHVSFITKASVDNHNDFLMEFTIENRAPFAIKDIAITCDQVAPTGAIIRSHAETLYDIIKPSTRSTYAPIPYGNKHRQTQSLQCQITNFTVENSKPDAG